MSHKQDAIKKMADDIREKMVGGTLFGEQVDFENNDMVLVAAYNMVKGEENLKNIQEWKTIRMLIGLGAKNVTPRCN